MQQFIIPGNPIAKKRPRFARRGKFVTTYNDQETEEGRFLWEIKQQIKRSPIKGPIKISCIFYMPRPKSHYGTGKNAGKLKLNAPALHTKKSDLDNLEKFVYDCLNHVVWKDDSQIVESIAKKLYSDKPRTEIKIWTTEKNE
ncbi:RusA family crossover junction endodeoxyribonuclease [candidate division WOR-3 bacterium]|nr:RusA family crossover junction endodeoxyribonuclease [candidate division WOR-3 bacterium]